MLGEVEPNKVNVLILCAEAICAGPVSPDNIKSISLNIALLSDMLKLPEQIITLFVASCSWYFFSDFPPHTKIVPPYKFCSFSISFFQFWIFQIRPCLLLSVAPPAIIAICGF